MKWDIYKAKAWMLRTGMEHIEGGLFAEGGEMVYEAKWGNGCDTPESFFEVLKEVCCWDDDIIEDAMKEAME